MKKLALVFSIALVPLFGMAQGNLLSNFYGKYAGQDGFTSVNVTADLFNLFTSIEGDEDMQELQTLMSGLKGIRVLAYENKDLGQGSTILNGSELFEEAMKQLPTGSFKELVTVKEKSDNVRIMARDTDNGMLQDMVILVGSEDEFVFVHIDGSVDLNTLMKMGDKMNMKGLDELKKLEQK